MFGIPLAAKQATIGYKGINRTAERKEEDAMKKRILMTVAGLGASILVAGSGPVFAGENNFDPWQTSGPAETGSIASPEGVNPAGKAISEANREKGNAPSEVDLYPEKW